MHSIPKESLTFLPHALHARSSVAMFTLSPDSGSVGDGTNPGNNSTLFHPLIPR